MKRISGNTFLIEGPTNVGVYVSDDTVYLIDAGGSRKILRESVRDLMSKKVVLLITHHHSDHIKNAAYIQRMTGCDAFAPLGEISMITNPILESYILFGAHPPKSLRGEFFVSKPVKVEPLKGDMPVKIVELPGHTPFHVGYMTPDGVLFSGDLYFSKEVLRKYSYPYHSSISELRETLKNLPEFDFIVPAHGEPSKDPSDDLKFMMDSIESYENAVLDIIREPLLSDEVALMLSERFGLELQKGFWYLFRSFVMALLEDLERQGEISENSGRWSVSKGGKG